MPAPQAILDLVQRFHYNQVVERSLIEKGTIILQKCNPDYELYGLTEEEIKIVEG